MGRQTPAMPVFLYHAQLGWLAPIGPADTLVDTYCRDPAGRVTYVRDHFSEHVTLEPIARGTIMRWLRDRISGVPAQPGCVTTDPASIAFN
ncbi:lipase family protein [Nocardia vulneris]|uniref:lipase family protein n=1 Tax=Nocardia vulneris TaxID=1141657 RepID=UPI0030D1C8B7